MPKVYPHDFDLSKLGVLTHNEEKSILKIVDDIIDNLDEEAFYQLAGGSEKDVYKLLYNLVTDVHDTVINHQGPLKGSSFDYLDKLQDNVEMTLRRKNFAYFIESCLSNYKMNWHHLEWCSHVQTYQKLCIEASRGSGKTRFFSENYSLWKMYSYQRQSPMEKIDLVNSLCEYGMIFTYEMGLGEEIMLNIKNQIEDNDILRDVLYSETKKENWAQRSIKTKNGARLQVKSYGGAARGRHPSYIVVDDFLIENVLYSAEVNKKIISYFNSVISNMPVKKGQLICVGTPFTSNDLYSELRKNKKYKYFEYPFIFPDGTLLWPEWFSYQDILDKKAEIGNLAFSREILCKPISNDSTIFPYHILQQCFRTSATLIPNRFSSPIKFKRIVLGCDFAISANIGADFSVFLTLGVDENDRYWIININRSQGKSYVEQLAIIKMLHSNFKYDPIVMEQNAMQVIFVQGAKDSGLPVVGYTTGVERNDLKKGVPGLAILFENLRFIIPRGNQETVDATDILIAELGGITFGSKGITTTTKKDVVLSLWLATIAADYKQGFSFSFL